MPAFAHAPAPAPQITALRSVHEIEKLSDYLLDSMNALLKLVEQETALVRMGHIREAILLEERKTDLSRRYVTAISQLKANRSYIEKTAPNILSGLHRHHDAFRAILQINLTVLATAHAVSEGIVRGVSGEMQRRAVPQTYNAYGHSSAPSPRHAAPLAVSRSL